MFVQCKKKSEVTINSTYALSVICFWLPLAEGQHSFCRSECLVNEKFPWLCLNYHEILGTSPEEGMLQLNGPAPRIDSANSQKSGAKIKRGWSCLQSVALILEGHLSCFPTSRDNITRMAFPCHMNAACSIRIASSSTNNSGISVKHIVHRTTSVRNAQQEKKGDRTGVSLLRHLGPQLQCGRKERVCAGGEGTLPPRPMASHFSFAAVSATIKPFSKILAV